MHHACPHHAHALTRYPAHGFLTWRCERCDGVWLPGAVVRKVVTAPRWPATAAMRATMLHCPDDGRALWAWQTRGIELDCCTHCHGVWLDQGELDAIVAQRQQGDAATDRAEWQEEVAEGVGDLVEAALERSGSRAGSADDIPATSLRAPAVGGKRVEVEYEAPPPLPSAANAHNVLEAELSAGAGDSGMLDQVGELAGDAVGSALEFIGEIFSAL